MCIRDSGTWEEVPQNVTWWDKILPAADSTADRCKSFQCRPPSGSNRSLPAAEVAFPSTCQDGVSPRRISRSLLRIHYDDYRIPVNLQITNPLHCCSRTCSDDLFEIDR